MLDDSRETETNVVESGSREVIASDITLLPPKASFIVVKPQPLEMQATTNKVNRSNLHDHTPRSLETSETFSSPIRSASSGRSDGSAKNDARSHHG